jgi:hypothetical protein
MISLEQVCAWQVHISQSVSIQLDNGVAVFMGQPIFHWSIEQAGLRAATLSLH